MLISNTYKALIFTTLFSTAVVFLGFTIHIKKKAELVAETYYDLNPEALDEDEEEALDDILKSLDQLLATPSTNQALNENQKLEDKAFEEQLEAIKNRTTIDDIKAEQNNGFLTSPKNSVGNTDASKFDNINAIVNNRSENQKEISPNTANKNSTMSYSLVDRTHTFLPTPIYLCETGGKIVINITVNYQGNVIAAYYNSASSTSDNGCLIDHALEYAKGAKFNAVPPKATQIGSITFYFKGKH